MTEEMLDKNPVWYKLICQHCNKDGYITSSWKLPVDSNNIRPVEFEILPSNSEGYVRIRSKCNNCNGLKYMVYNSAEWKLEIIDPIPECNNET
jgi:hypothetical protein